MFVVVINEFAEDSLKLAPMKNQHRVEALTSNGAYEGPLLSHQISMPSQQGLWLDKEASSARCREKPAQSGKNRSIRGAQGRTRHLSAQDANFVAEHDDLDGQVLLPTT